MMAKDKETTPVITTWIPAPHDHSTPAEVPVEAPVVEEPVSE
jgi:hypothetical protein